MSSFFFFNDTATTEIYTLSLHDALPISILRSLMECLRPVLGPREAWTGNRANLNCLVGRSSLEKWRQPRKNRSEEHTSELQSRLHLVCRLLLEKKKISH